MFHAKADFTAYRLPLQPNLKTNSNLIFQKNLLSF